MGDKKDLTRIEDLAELLHDLNESDPVLPDTPDTPPENPFPEEVENEVEVEEELDSENEIAVAETPVEETTFELPTFETSNDEMTSTNVLPDSAPEFLENNNEIADFGHAEPEPEPEMAPEPIAAPMMEEEVEPVAPPTPTPQIFSDVKDFAENMSFGDMSAEGNPPFSIILKNIRFEEDAEKIIDVLKEYKIIKEENEAEIQKTINRGVLLIPRMSEFAAIYLSHRLRNLSCDLYMGLSEELHPPKNYDDKESRGLVTKRTLYQNYHHHLQFELDDISLSDIRVSTLSQLEGFDIREHLGIVTEHTTINSELLEKVPELNYEVLMETEEKNIDHKLLFADNATEESLTLNDVYRNLTEKLKPHAVHMKGNAIVGINYQVSPLPPDRYKVTCTGNVVVATAKEL
ncbi:MAG: hypothetical protein JNM93_11130 [Bacteriovoracaceae bacterium]|nr:hypothetical protein [Bacteriovoracaceae bacterium]